MKTPKSLNPGMLPAISISVVLTAFPCFASTLTFYNPLNMPAGSTYTIVFDTTTVVNGKSTNISTFNNLAASSAEAFLPGSSVLSWCAVVSTPTVNAIDNCGQNADAGGAIYNFFDGLEVADSFSDFTSQPLLNQITQADGGSGRFVWTGSTAGGVAS